MNTKNISKKRLEMAIFSKLDEELTEENKNIKLLTAYTLILYQKQKEEFILKKLIALTDELLKLKISQEELKENLEIFENDKLYELDNYTLDMLLDHYNEFFDEEKLNNKYKKHPLFQEIITSLNSIKEEQKELEKEIELKKEKLKIRDNDFKELTISLLNIEDLSKNIKEKIDEQQKYLEELSKKVETINKKMVEETFLVCINDMVDNMNDFIIKFGLGSLLFGSLGGVVASVFGINELAKGLKESFKLERRTRIIYECTDYEYEIIRNIDNVKYANNLVKDAISNVDALISLYKEKFSKYENKIPSYKETLIKLESVLETLNEKKALTETINKKMNENYEKNKEKVKKVRELSKK